MTYLHSAAVHLNAMRQGLQLSAKRMLQATSAAASRSGLQIWAAGIAVGAGLAGHDVQAGVLSKNLCRPYRQLVDNELFLTIAVVAGAILVIAWKLAPSGTYMQKAVGLLAALVIGLNLENLLQTGFGIGLAC